MLDNVDRVLERGEKIESLIDKSDNLEATSLMFKSNSRQLKRTGFALPSLPSVSLPSFSFGSASAAPAAASPPPPPPSPSPSVSPPSPVASPPPAEEPAKREPRPQAEAESSHDSSSNPEPPVNPQERSERDTGALQAGLSGPSAGTQRDYTQVPTELDSVLGEFDEGHVRPTSLKAGTAWIRRRVTLLHPDRPSAGLTLEQLKSEKAGAFDLLDVLSRSGELPLTADLLVLVAATHCFPASLVSTVVAGNVNPIERFETAAQLFCSVVHQQPTDSIVLRRT